MGISKYLIVLFIPITILKADVILFPSTEYRSGNMLSYSLEGITSYEIIINDHNTMNFWGGAGAVGPINNNNLIKSPAYGLEFAQELRYYYQNEKYTKFNLGVYCGYAYMFFPYHDQFPNIPARSIALVPGLKLTYKQNISSRLVLEPYLGFSLPCYMYEETHTYNLSHAEGSYSYTENIYHIERIVTVGLRVGFNKVIELNK